MELKLAIVRGHRPSAALADDRSQAYVSQCRRTSLEAARDLLERAALDAESMVTDARRRSDDIRRSAFEDGLSAAEGRWADAALALAERRAAVLENLETDCVQVALEIARQLIGAAIAVDASVVEEIAARACAPLRRDAALVLAVSPVHADRVESLRKRLGDHRPVAIEFDASLRAADCRAECGGVRVDARLSVQLDNIERRLLRDEREACQP